MVIGGGPTGVEMAGALIELFQNALKDDYPELPIEKARVVLVEAGPELLNAFSDESKKHALEVLRDRGVHVVTNERVIEVSGDAIYLGSKRMIKTATPIWAVGVKASPLANLLQLEQTRGGRIVVNADLSIPEKAGAYVIGDMAGSCDENGRLHPQLASVARQGARHVAGQIRGMLASKPAKAFVYKSPGIMATVGRHAAVAEFPGEIRLEGFFAWLTWLMLHLLLLVGLKNRLHVLVSWLCNYCTRDRSARLILEPEENALQNSAELPPIPALPSVNLPEKVTSSMARAREHHEGSVEHEEALQRIQHILSKSHAESKSQAAT